MKVLENINEEIDQAELDIQDYKDKIQTLVAMSEHATPDQKRQYDKAITFAGRQIQVIRLAQLIMLEEHKVKEIVSSN
jgi:hypothetical protein